MNQQGQSNDYQTEQQLLQGATHPDYPHLLGKSLIDKIVNKPKNEDIRNMSLTEAIDFINEITLGTYYTTMYIGLCSFTRKIYDESDIFCKRLRGCSNTHRLPGGMIQCSNEAEHFIECCSMEHNIRNKLYPMSLTNITSSKELIIPRSTRSPSDPPRFSDGNIGENCAMFLSRTQGTLHVKVEFVDNDTCNKMEKSVPLKNLMRVNSISSIKLSPIYYSDQYISEQSDNVQRLFNYYNQRYTEFVDEFVITKLIHESIPYTLEPQEYNPDKPVRY